MARHIFLTGPKQVGKTTLLRAALADFPGSVGGFCTLRTRAYLGDAWSVHLLRPGCGEAPGPQNLLFVCGAADGETASRFDRLGTAALAEGAGRDVLLMDELGPHEARAAVFRQAVLAALDGVVPILGVLQAAPSPFLEEVARHPQVRLIQVTAENRDDPALLAALRAAAAGRGGL